MVKFSIETTRISLFSESLTNTIPVAASFALESHNGKITPVGDAIIATNRPYLAFFLYQWPPD